VPGRACLLRGRAPSSARITSRISDRLAGARASLSRRGSRASVKAARLQLNSGYGALRVKHVRGDLALETTSGSISVDDVQSAISPRVGGRRAVSAMRGSAPDRRH
jgi:hypothetical protein